MNISKSNMAKRRTSVPRIEMDLRGLTKGSFDAHLMKEYDEFYRRIVEFVLNKIENQEDGDLLAILVDETGEEFDMNLPEDGYRRAINKALEYFEYIEEYETCDLIKQLENNL